MGLPSNVLAPFISSCILFKFHPPLFTQQKLKMNKKKRGKQKKIKWIDFHFFQGIAWVRVWAANELGIYLVKHDEKTKANYINNMINQFGA